MLQRAHSSSISRTLVISLLLVLPLSVGAQQKKKMVVAERDTVPLFRGIAVSTDVVGPAQLVFGDYGQYQAALRVNLKDKWFPIVELGYGKADAKDISTKMAYKTNAPYGRIGMDWNLSKNKHDIYRIYGGLRYAYTSFKYDVDGRDITDPIWGDKIDIAAHRQKAGYHWLEFAFSIDAKIWGPLRMGWSVRYKRRLYHSHDEIGEPWFIPGYGRNGNSRLGGEYNLIVEL